MIFDLDQPFFFKVNTLKNKMKYITPRSYLKRIGTMKCL